MQLDVGEGIDPPVAASAFELFLFDAIVPVGRCVVVALLPAILILLVEAENVDGVHDEAALDA
jgi:hypothetical protein